MLKTCYFIFPLLLFLGCSKNAPEKAIKTNSLSSYVNPFIGTGGHGHTYPGATMPFGMVQLSPDTRLDGWDGCSGYHYSDEYIYGFSHTHLSGTGVSDYGDILLMPTNAPILNNGADGKPGYRAHFSHENEIASPGYYSVHLDSTNINVSLTVTERTGMHKYQYPSKENQFLILDLDHRDELLSHEINVNSATSISGHRFSKAWAEDQRLYFYMTFSKPIKNWDFKFEKSPNKRAFEFDNPNNDPIYVSVGISAVDIEGAKNNLFQEIGELSFDDIKQVAHETWENQLEKVVVESNNEQHKEVFYTSLYHSMLAPNLYQDFDGRYRGMDLEIHKNEKHTNYTVFSLWDTYRATHPLFTIIEQERTNDFINTFINKYEEGGIMPIWDLSANYTGCMIGYHAVPVISDAYLKGITGYDAEKAYKAMKHSAMQNKLGLESYKQYGFIPVEKESESVSKTLEYAYDDWTIAQMAKAMEKMDDYEYFSKRAQAYKNIYDPESKFMRGRIRNTWFSPFDPYEVNFNYTEANSWQYSFYVPQDISGFIDLMGGKQALENQLDSLFTAKKETSGRNQADITGLIGQYAHGNEPSHHMAYLYNFINKPEKTQQYVHQILTELYTNQPDGISGNEDCGQMSSWYVLSSLGFYPVTPGSNEYIIGTPLHPKATINLENGNHFTIIANNVSETNKYISSVELNGEKLKRSYIYHDEIMTGGNLIFEMSATPSQWATQDANIPKTTIDEHLIVAAPFIADGDVAFKYQTSISLESIDNESTIFYSFNGDAFSEYKEPVTIKEEGTLKVYAEKEGQKSAVIKTDFFKIDPNKSIELFSEYANQYNGGGTNALIDGIKGGEDFRAGAWQGYWNEDFNGVVNLGSKKDINEVEIRFLEDQRSWIFYPTQVKVSASSDGKIFKPIQTINIDATVPSNNANIKSVIVKANAKDIQYIRVEATTLGVLPVWHLGHKHDGRSWIFLDEITIK